MNPSNSQKMTFFQMALLMGAVVCAVDSGAMAGSLVAWGSDGFGQVSNTPEGTDFVVVSAGDLHSVALRSDGSLVAWGVEDGSVYDYDQISDTPSGYNFIAVSAGAFHNVALRSDESLVAWGYDGNNEVSDTPIGNEFVSVSAGSSHCVALKSNGSLVAWGYDGHGQVSNTPTGNDFLAVSAGRYHNIALKSDHSIVAWGVEGDEVITGVPTGNDFVAIAAGYLHNMALKSDGSIVSWGYDEFGLVNNTPVGNDFTAISAGFFHSLGLRFDGSLVAWGDDSAGQVSETPTIKGFEAVTTGQFHNVAIISNPVEAVNIDWIWFKIEKNHTAGTPESEPFDIGALVSGTNLNSIEVTSPTGIAEELEQGDNYWTWDREEKYATLEDLYDEFPPGDYLLVFNKGEESEDSVIISFEPEQQPTGFGNVTYPADGAINVELSPKFKWDSCSDYGENLYVAVVDDDEDVYWDNLDIEQVSWAPGPLMPGHQVEFEIIVENTGEMTGSTENGDTFNFIDVFQWTNEIRFTTEPLPSDLDIEMLGISATKQFRDGVPQGEFPWSLDIMVSVANPDTLHHIDVTKPGDSEPFVTLYEEDAPAGWWGTSFDDDYTSLDALRVVYKEGPYRFDFLNIDSVMIRSIYIDYTGLPGEPAEPVDFVYPSTNGQTGISINPTFTWNISSEAGDALMRVVENDAPIYFEAPVPIGSTSWSPGPLLANHQYELDVLVINIKDWTGGPGFPITTDSTGDTFSYAHTIEYLNEIVFITQSSGDPVDEIEEILDLVYESIEDGTLTGEGPGNSADNRLNALRNKLEDARRLIEAGRYEEACDQLWSTYRKCDGESHPPDFVTGEAADDLADMILLMMDDLGC